MAQKIGSAVCGCSSAGGSSGLSALKDIGQPVDEEKHKDCAIRIVSIREKDNGAGPEYIASGAEIRLRTWSTTNFSICAAGIDLDGQVCQPRFWALQQT